jgi:hypothetical protein
MTVASRRKMKAKPWRRAELWERSEGEKGRISIAGKTQHPSLPLPTRLAFD